MLALLLSLEGVFITANVGSCLTALLGHFGICNLPQRVHCISSSYRRQELSSILKALQSDILEVVMFIAPPHLPLTLETYVVVQVKVTGKVTDSLNVAN